MVIIETHVFTRQLQSALSDEDYCLLQQLLLEHPEAGDIISGCGGLRKLRWRAEGRGKRGGIRLIYYWFSTRHTILLLFIYPKNVQDDLTVDQLRQLKKVVEEEYHEK